ncbi:MAG: glycosyltransferase family 9 protein [Gemmatimonadota bacterium]|nr:glycosyltransferase family 9 protein [Gemmatimonadota bacterium]
MSAVPDRVCIVLLTGLGDVVNGLPLANTLKATNPRCHVTWVAEPMPAQILRPHPAVDEVVVYEKRRGVAGVLDLRRKLRGRRFDLTLNLNVYFKSVWPTLLSGAPRRIGFGRDRAREGVWLAANEHLPARPQRHNVDMFLEFAEHLGVPVGGVEWRIPITGEERRAQAEFFAPLAGRPVAAVVPAASLRSRTWFADRYARVVDALEHDFGFRTMLVGGRGERELRVAEEIVERASAKPLWAMGRPVREMVWQLEGSNLVVSPDTGPLHVARALRVPVVGLYGQTNPWRTGPYPGSDYPELWVDRYTDPGEKPDPSNFTPKLGRMEQITVQDVLERVEHALRHHLGGPAPRATEVERG